MEGKGKIRGKRGAQYSGGKGKGKISSKIMAQNKGGKEQNKGGNYEKGKDKIEGKILRGKGQK